MHLKSKINLGLMLAILFFTILPLSSSATTFHFIAVDADMSDWDSDELLASSTGANFYVTWDDRAIYIGVTGVGLGSNDIAFSFNLNTTEPPLGGSTSALAGAAFATNIAPEYLGAYTTSGGIGQIVLATYNGSNGWNNWIIRDIEWQKSYGFTGGFRAEIGISRSSLGSPLDSTPWGIILWAVNNAHDSTWSVAPAANPTSSGPGNVTMLYEHHFPSMGPGVKPSTGELLMPIELTILTNSLPNGTVGSPYNSPVSAAYGVPPYTWSIATGNLPPGLTLTQLTTWGIYATPTSTGSYNFTLQVTDSRSSTASKPLSISVTLGSLLITTNSLPNGREGVPYNTTLSASGGLIPYTWSIVTGSGNLPPGLTLNPSSGLISGTPTVNGTYNFIAKVTDSLFSMATKAFSINIDTATQLFITTDSLPIGTLGVGYDYSISAAYGVIPYTWSIVTGNLPPGLTFSISTYDGRISGTPTELGTYNFTVRVTDAISSTAMKSFALNIHSKIPVATASASRTSGLVPLTVSFTGYGIDSDGYIFNHQWDFDGNGSIDWESPISGNVTHTYSQWGTYTATFTVTDNSGMMDSDTLVISVFSTAGTPTASANATPTTGSAPLTVDFTGGAVSANPIILYLWDFEGNGSYDWANTSTGNTSHTYGSAGIYYPTLLVMDSEGLSDTDSKTIIVTTGTGTPTATAFATPTSGSVPLTINFNGTGSDPGGSVIAYLWDFDGDGSFDWTSTDTAGTSYTYTASGDYLARLRVIDNSGLTADATVAISVSNPTTLTVWVTTPEDGQMLAGDSISILAETSNPTSTQSIEFQYKLTSAPTWDTIATDSIATDGFSTLWDITGLSSGSTYSLRAVAKDSASYTYNSTPITVTITTVSGFFIRTEGKLDLTMVGQPDIAEWTSGSGDHYKQQKVFASKNNIIQLYDGTEVSIPYGAISADTTLTIGLLPSLGTSLMSNFYQGIIREIKIGNSSFNFSKLIMIKVPYPDLNNNGKVDGTNVNETETYLAWFDPAVSSWKKVVTSGVSSGENYVSGQVAHLTQFRVIGGRATAVSHKLWELYE